MGTSDGEGRRLMSTSDGEGRQLMSKSAMKMTGLALMMVSVFAILFGVHATEMGAPEVVGFVLGLAGVVMLLGGLILYVVVKKD